MLALLLVLATVVHQDTTIVIHPDSSGATIQAIELPRVVTDEIIRFGLHEYLVDFLERVAGLSSEVSRVFLVPTY